MAACLAASAKTFSVSTFASSTDSSIPVAKCCAGWAAGADDDDDAVWAVGPYVSAGPCGVGISCCVNMCPGAGGCPGAATCPCAGGCPRLGGREMCLRGGPRADAC